MSSIKKAIEIPEQVTVKITSDGVIVTGPRGSVSRRIPEGIGVEVKEDGIRVFMKRKDKEVKKLLRTIRTLISNMVLGVSSGWRKSLELVGTGFKAEVIGDELILSVGFSHPVRIKAPPGIDFKVEKTTILVEGADKEKVGEISAKIRAIRPPEPYKGKGIRYSNEVIRRKVGKATKTTAG